MEKVARFSMGMQFAKSQYKDDPEGHLCYYADYVLMKERAEKAEYELARRDVAAGEPVAWVVLAPQGDYIERNAAVVAHLEGTGYRVG